MKNSKLGLERMLEVFPSGFDIFHCDWFEQYEAFCGDVCVFEGVQSVSMFNSVDRNLRSLRIFIPEDNLFKIIKIPLNEQQRKTIKKGSKRKP